MYVKPAFKSKIIGHNLLQTIINEAFKIFDLEVQTLDVVAENVAANKVYEELGFVEYGFLKNYHKADGKYIHHCFVALYKN